MGVDTCIYLEGDVKVQDVAEVIGIFAGLKPYRYDHDDAWGNKDCWWTKVDGVEVKAGIVSCAEIIITAPEGETLVDGEESHWVLYHFEPSDKESYMRLVMPRSTPFWIAVGKKLVKFFGGKMDYNDCDEKRVDYRAKKPRRVNCPQDGKEWEDFQTEMLNLKPVTVADLKAAQKYAAYEVPLPGEKEVEKV
jgi:hypothetical protein